MTLCVYELQAEEGPAACRGLPTRTDCPIGSADVGRAGHVRPVSIGVSCMFCAMCQAYLRWIGATARRPDLRAARIAEVVDLLAAGIKQRPRE